MMNKAALYISVLALFIIGVLLYSGYERTQSIIDKNDKIELEEIGRKEIMAYKKMIFVLQDSIGGEPILYHVQKNTADTTYALLSTPIGRYSGNFVIPVINTYQNLQVFQDTIHSISLPEIRQMVTDAHSFNAWRLRLPTQNNGITAIVAQQNAVAFFGFFFVPFFILFLAQAFIIAMRNKYQVNWTILTYIVIIIGLIIIDQINLRQVFNEHSFENYKSTAMSSFFQRLLDFIPLFVFYQWYFRGRGSKYGFVDREVLKFLTIFFGLFLVALLNPYNGLAGLSWEDRLYHSFVMNMISGLPIAMANLLVNVLREAYLKSKNQLTIAKKDALSSQSTLNALQASVNPHFLYNALNSIATLAETDAERTQQMTLALSAFYKYNTNREQQPLVPLGDELEMIKTYLEIEKIRFEDRLLFSIKMDENLKAEKVPHFLLQPLVENAVKYGYNKQTDQISIGILIKKVNAILSIAIYDQGKAFPENLEKGYGLMSVTKKLKLLFPDRHEIAFINGPEKHLLIELNTNEHD